MQSALRRSALTPAEREIVGITVSRENGSAYSMAAHSTFAERAGLAPEEIAALRDGGTLADARHEALHAFTVELLHSHGQVAADDLLAAGYTAEQALEVVTQVAYTTMANFAAGVAGHPGRRRLRGLRLGCGLTKLAGSAGRLRALVGGPLPSARPQRLEDLLEGAAVEQLDRQLRRARGSRCRSACRPRRRCPHRARGSGCRRRRRRPPPRCARPRCGTRPRARASGSRTWRRARARGSRARDPGRRPTSRSRSRGRAARARRRGRRGSRRRSRPAGGSCWTSLPRIANAPPVGPRLSPRPPLEARPRAGGRSCREDISRRRAGVPRPVRPTRRRPGQAG